MWWNGIAEVSDWHYWTQPRLHRRCAEADTADTSRTSCPASQKYQSYSMPSHFRLIPVGTPKIHQKRVYQFLIRLLMLNISGSNEVIFKQHLRNYFS